MLYFQSFLQYINKFLSLAFQKNKIVCKHVNLPIIKLMSRIVNDTCLQIQFTLVHFVQFGLFGPLQYTMVHLGPLWFIPSNWSIQSNSIHSVQKCPIRSISVDFGLSGPLYPFGPIWTTSAHSIQSGPLQSFQSKITKSYITIFNYLI